MSQHRSAQSSIIGRLHLAPAALVAGVAASAALALATTGTLSAFTAQITNSANTVASGSLVMQEVGADGTTTCTSTDTSGTGNGVNTNAFTCSTINKYGGSVTLVPGGAASTSSVTIKNTGTVPAATFTLAPGTCTQSTGPSANPSGNATTLCSKLNVVITQGGNTITPANSTAASLAGTTLTLATPVAPGEARTYAFSVALDTSAGNTFQNQRATQPLVWTFTS